MYLPPSQTAVPAARVRTDANRFRPDIEGLRAIAVMAVLLYHLGISWLPGGFTGVDIFFVISGFLMIQILSRNGLQIWDFYGRRICRIWPAMFVLILTTLVIGAATLVPDDLAYLAKSAASSLIAGNNILYWVQSGYFTPDAQQNLLLHLWSLAVEQQFYLTVPFLMMILMWRVSSPRVWLLVAITLASLALCIYATPRARTASFYLLPTRYWEFLVGGIVAVVTPRIKISPWVWECLAAAGCVVIAASVLWLNPATSFPGYLALLPCVGTACVLAGGTHYATAISRLLSTRIATFTGQLSYSLYLWHWPIITYCRVWGIAIDSTSTRLLLLVLSFGISYFSWRYIEVPFREGGTVAFRARIATLAAFALGIAVASGIFLESAGLPDRLDPQSRAILAYEHYPAKLALYRQGSCFLVPGESVSDFRLEDCSESVPGRSRVLLWGDSHAAHYAPGMRHFSEKYGFNLVQASYGGCAPLPLRPDNSATCAEFGRKILLLAASGKFDVVFISANWTGYPKVLSELRALVQELGASGVKVVIIGPSIEFRRTLPKLLASRPVGLPLRTFSADDWLSSDVISIGHEMRELFSRMATVTYVDPVTEVCHGRICPVLADGNVPLVWDASHLTEEGSIRVTASLLAKLAELLRLANSSNMKKAP